MILFSEITFADISAIEIYYRKQSAHTLRVATTVIRLLSDSEFLTAHPEFKPIASKAKAALRTSLVHDKAKTLDTAFNAVLAGSDGVDYRSLADSNPQKTKIIEAVKQLNGKDEVFWKQARRRFSLIESKRHLLEQLVGAADYCDVPMSRVSEFGDGKIRKIDKASDWIPKLNHLSVEDRSGMTRVAQFLESHPEKFKDIYSEITPQKLAKNGMPTYMKALRNEAKTIQGLSKPEIIRKASLGSRALGATGLLITPALVGAEYIADPVFSKSGETFIEIISSSSVLAKCQTIGCTSVFRECKDKGWGEDKCNIEFFKKPLNEQTRLRLGDDLDLILKAKAPLIVNLSCNKTYGSSDLIKFSIVNFNNDLQEQVIIFDDSRKIKSIKINNTDGRLRPADLINFTDNQPDKLILYQKPKVSKYSTNPGEWTSLVIPKKDWEDKKMYFWTSGSAEQKNQIKRSQETLRSIRNQKNSLLTCCESSQCINYFNKLTKSRQHNVRSNELNKNGSAYLVNTSH